MADGWVDFVAGWVSGIAGTVVGHPLDTIKVLQQTESRSVIQCFSQTLQNEGVGGFFKGMASPLLSAGVMNALFFGVYGNTLRLLGGTGRDAPSLRDVMIAGSTAGAAQLVISCPVDLVKIKLQTQTACSVNINGSVLYKGPLDCLVQLHSAHGFAGWYKGLKIMAYRDVPSYGGYMVIYEWFSRTGKRYKLDISITALCAGGAAGVLAWAMIIPLDVVKSRIQADNPVRGKYNGIFDCFVKSYRAEGTAVFFRGSLAVILRALPVNAATFFAYDTVLRALIHK